MTTSLRLQAYKSPQTMSCGKTLRATAVAIALVLLYLVPAHAGGPQYVAGTSFFDSGLAGQPLIWSNGAISYYTDQGSLSGILPGPTADAFVADAFSRWTSIPTAAFSATRAGQLDEDVNGTNVIFNSDRTITMPVDTQPTATEKPLAIVYDADGKVTDALIGAGANLDCVANGAFGGVDAFAPDGHFAHALIILNGKCGQTSNNLPDLKYHLVRVLGEVLGLGWSQLNLNAVTGIPTPTQDALAGLPVMHERDLSGCVPVSKCYPNADQPRMDDRAAFSQLYPVTSANIANYSNKQTFSDNTARIHGSVFFTDASGNAVQPMQGVNVVARWIDTTGQPSDKFAVSSISGFRFSGNAGNAITGYSDALGQPYSRFGSSDAALEGFFDLMGLEIPVGESAQYRLTVEGLDPDLSCNTGPYAPWQVSPSGSAQPITVTITRGSDQQQDILMTASAGDSFERAETDTYAQPQPINRRGVWTGSLSGYGDADYFSIAGQANRTLTVEVTALDESDVATTQKAQPLIGMWSMDAAGGTLPSSYTFSPFNTVTPGLTQLSTELVSGTQFRIGIADLRGDGRPDFRYRARVLYGNAVNPVRVGVLGGTPVLISGIGFKPGMTLKFGTITGTVLASSNSQLVVMAPPMGDGIQTLTITDPATGATSALMGAMTTGAGPDDSIRLAQTNNSATPVGIEAAYPVRVNVTTADGSSPVAGATVQWSAGNRAGLSACNGAAACTAVTDESGMAETRVTIGATGATTITATLAPASYTPAKFVQTSISGTSSAKDLALLTPKIWVAKGATVDIPLTARLLSNGAGLSGQTLNWLIALGSGSLTPSTSLTDGNGYARSTLHVSTLSADIQGNVCLAPANNPCQTFYIVQVAPSALRLQPASGSLQAVWVGQSFQPVVVRATNSATPANPVMGATVSFQAMIFLPDADAPVEVSGDDGSSQHAMKVLLASSQSTVTTDVSGLASLLPSTAGISRPLEVEITASAGTSSPLQFELPMLSPPAILPGESTGAPRLPAKWARRLIRSVRRWADDPESNDGAKPTKP